MENSLLERDWFTNTCPMCQIVHTFWAFWPLLPTPGPVLSPLPCTHGSSRVVSGLLPTNTIMMPDPDPSSETLNTRRLS